jgi:hypothetical protein
MIDNAGSRHLFPLPFGIIIAAIYFYPLSIPYEMRKPSPGTNGHYSHCILQEEQRYYTA